MFYYRLLEKQWFTEGMLLSAPVTRNQIQVRNASKLIHCISVGKSEANTAAVNVNHAPEHVKKKAKICNINNRCARVQEEKLARK